MTSAYRVDTLERLQEVWPRVSGWLRAANEHSRENRNLLDIYEAVRNDPYVQLWVTDSAAVVTQTVQERDGWVVHFWLGGGSLDGLREIHPLVESFARGLHCVRLSLRGRPGWVRSFLSKEEGWRTVKQVEMEKDL